MLLTGMESGPTKVTLGGYNEYLHAMDYIRIYPVRILKWTR